MKATAHRIFSSVASGVDISINRLLIACATKGWSLASYNQDHQKLNLVSLPHVLVTATWDDSWRLDPLESMMIP